MKNLNIIIVNDYGYIEGGASKIALLTAMELAYKGYSVTLLCAVGPVMPQLEKSGVKVICLEQYDILNDKNRLRAFFKGLWNVKAYKVMSDILSAKDKENTVIHIHTWTKALSSSVYRAIIDKEFKNVLTAHDYFSICCNGGMFNYRKEAFCSIKPLSYKCLRENCDSRKYVHKLWRYLRSVIQQSVGKLNCLENVIYISEFSKKILEPNLSDKINWFYLHNPIDFTKKKLINISRNNTYIFLGRLSKEKGVVHLAKAAGDLQIKIMFIGDGSERDTIKSIYPDAVITGWLNKNELTEILKQARCLIISSLLPETFGLVALEAASYGIPVIVSDLCAPREEIEDKRTGLWYRGGSIDDLKDKIKQMENDDLIVNFSRQIYNSYWDNPYNIDDYIKNLTIIYTKILKLED